MRFYTTQHQYPCGIDLHARSLYLCILDRTGAKQLHRKIGATPTPSSKLWPPPAKI